MKLFRISIGLVILSVLAVDANATPFLGVGWNFSVLGASTVTNTGATTLNANLGVSPGTAVTGSGTITFTGAPGNNSIVPLSAAAAGQIAATNAVSAMNALGVANQSFLGNLTGLTLQTVGANTVFDVGALGGFTLTSGGVLTLDFRGLSNQNIVFRMSSTLVADTGSSVKVINGGGTNNNVFWEVGSSATLNAGTSFVGNIIASASVSMLAAAKIGCGSVVAQTGGVTMINNTISDVCSYSAGGTGTPPVGTVLPSLGSGNEVVKVPEGGSTLLYLLASLVSLGAFMAFRRSI